MTSGRVGISQAMTVRGTAAAGGFRGVLLEKQDFGSWQTVTAGGSAAITFDHAPFDTNSFRSGSTAVIPTGLSGTYRISSFMACVIAPSASGYSMQTYQAKGVVGVGHGQNYGSANTGGLTEGVVIPPWLLTLAAGDVISQHLDNNSSAASIQIISTSWLLLEFLG